MLELFSSSGNSPTFQSSGSYKRKSLINTIFGNPNKENRKVQNEHFSQKETQLTTCSKKLKGPVKWTFQKNKSSWFKINFIQYLLSMIKIFYLCE